MWNMVIKMMSMSEEIVGFLDQLGLRFLQTVIIVRMIQKLINLVDWETCGWKKGLCYPKLSGIKLKRFEINEWSQTRVLFKC